MQPKPTPSDAARSPANRKRPARKNLRRAKKGHGKSIRRLAMTFILKSRAQLGAALPTGM
jgi:hypothetical protein